ncbi:type II 3-dehydroquinate dehydratase [Candidatus Poribacteria bacterium]
MAKILLIQGANLCWLGKREPEIYGTTSAADVDAMVREHARKHGYDVDIFYTNHEGECIDRIYQAHDEGVDALVMNPGGFTYAAYAIADTIKGVAPLPYVEVHISNQAARGIESATAKAAGCVIHGIGIYGYILGLEAALHLVEGRGLSDFLRLSV